MIAGLKICLCINLVKIKVLHVYTHQCRWRVTRLLLYTFRSHPSGWRAIDQPSVRWNIRRLVFLEDDCDVQPFLFLGTTRKRKCTDVIFGWANISKSWDSSSPGILSWVTLYHIYILTFSFYQDISFLFIPNMVLVFLPLSCLFKPIVGGGAFFSSIERTLDQAQGSNCTVWLLLIHHRTAIHSTGILIFYIKGF